MGDLLVNSRKVVFIFWSTLLLGSLSGGIVGVLTNLDRYLGDGAENFLIGLVWMLGISAAFTLVSQMGFFRIFIYTSFWSGLVSIAQIMEPYPVGPDCVCLFLT